MFFGLRNPGGTVSIKTGTVLSPYGVHKRTHAGISPISHVGGSPASSLLGAGMGREAGGDLWHRFIKPYYQDVIGTEPMSTQRFDGPDCSQLSELGEF